MQAVVGPYGLFVNLTYYSLYKRWQKEQGGITLVSGMPIETDDRAQAKISGVMLAVLNSATALAPPGSGLPNYSTSWHAADDTVWPIDANMIKAMNNELQNHINVCFAASAQVLAGIADGTVTTREQIDATFDDIVTRT